MKGDKGDKGDTGEVDTSDFYTKAEVDALIANSGGSSAGEGWSGQITSWEVLDAENYGQNLCWYNLSAISFNGAKYIGVEVFDSDSTGEVEMKVNCSLEYIDVSDGSKDEVLFFASSAWNDSPATILIPVFRYGVANGEKPSLNSIYLYIEAEHSKGETIKSDWITVKAYY